ncbi:hypothetical protein [Campylobacter sp. RM16190]|nr:hypothetical protein [Campylobacter sp. RM16190]
MDKIIKFAEKMAGKGEFDYKIFNELYEDYMYGQDEFGFNIKAV